MPLPNFFDSEDYKKIELDFESFSEKGIFDIVREAPQLIQRCETFLDTVFYQYLKHVTFNKVSNDERGILAKKEDELREKILAIKDYCQDYAIKRRQDIVCECVSSILSDDELTVEAIDDFLMILEEKEKSSEEISEALQLACEAAWQNIKSLQVKAAMTEGKEQESHLQDILDYESFVRQLQNRFAIENDGALLERDASATSTAIGLEDDNMYDISDSDESTTIKSENDGSDIEYDLYGSFNSLDEEELNSQDLSAAAPDIKNPAALLLSNDLYQAR